MVKKKHALALFPLALCFSSPVVLAAATTTELEQRLQEQEKKILRLENQLKGTRAAVKEDRTRINEMQERLRINGFLSAGVAQNDGDQVEDSFYGVSDNYSTAVVNKLGVQMTFQVSEDFSATAQLVSRGTKDYNVEAEWAYLTYQATNSLRFNIGRQRLPYYLLSEYLDVGYALPWVLPPIELYNIPLSATDGISALYDFSAGPVNFTWQTYAGMNSGFSEQLEADFRSNQSWGSNIVAEWGALTMRVGYSAARLTASPVEGGSGDQLISAIETAQTTLVPALNGLGIPVAAAPDWAGSLEDLSTDYISAGFMYDDGNLLVLGEIANLSVDDTVQPVGDAGYLTVGYRFGKWMPHITYAKFQTDAKNDKQVRQMQAYADAVGQAAFGAVTAPLAAGGLNAGINAILGLPYPAPSSQFLATGSSICTTPSVTCTADSLVLMGLRDNLLSAATGYSETLYNTLESQIQEQQSVTLGLTYDVSSRVKAKAQVTHYEGFGEGNYQTLGSTPVNSATTLYSGFSTSNIDGNGRFIGEPGATGNHTAIYSFSIDAVF